MPGRVILAVLSGLLLSLAFEPVAWPVVLPVAVAGYVLALRGLRPRRALLPGAGFGLAFFLAHIWWLVDSIGTVAWLLLSGIEGAFYAALAPVAVVLLRLPWWPLWLSAAWVAAEGLRTEWPWSGMPWGRLSFAAVDTPLAASIAYLGSAGLSFVLALLGCLLAAGVTASGLRGRLVPLGAALVLAVVASLPTWLPWRLSTTGSATVAVVQGGVPGAGNDVLFDPVGLTDNHVRATEELAGDVDAGELPRPDLVIWPENSTARDPFASAEVNAGIERAVAAIGVPVLVGGLVDGGPDHVYNQGIVWDPETGPGERYSKRHPVAFGEYIPGRGVVEALGLEDFSQLSRIPRDMLAGERSEPLQVAGVAIADAICFDIGFDDGLYAQQREGAELMVVQTSNASYIFTDQVDQQFAITRLRAIESGRWLAVASTNGLSGVISPDGEVVATAERLGSAALVEEVQLAQGLTPGVWMGAWPSRLFAVSTLLGLLMGILTYRRGAGWPHRTPGGRAASSSPALERQSA